MVKRIIILIGILTFTFFIAINIFNKKNITTIDGNKYAISVNGTKQNKFPDMGNYDVSISCKNATGTWDYANWRLEINNITSNSANCNISFNSASAKTKLNDKIKSLNNQTVGNGKVVNENGYRYEGKNPNNYILFNGELWRIIGTFDENNNGNYLTKIIRNEALGSYAWTTGYNNNWSSSWLNTLLNNYYYNNEDYYSSCYYSAMGPRSDTKVSHNCYFESKGIGINDIYRNFIEKTKWYLRTSGDSLNSVDAVYNNERTGTLPSNGVGEINAYIGLMYLSDIGYSILSSDCSRSNTSWRSDASCIQDSWLIKYSPEWILTWMTTYSVFRIANDRVEDVTPKISCVIRPTVYLKSNVYVVSGDGSYNNPYVIGI